MVPLHKISWSLLRLEQYAIEFFLSVSSVAASVALVRAPLDMRVAYGPYFSLLADITQDTRIWGVVVLGAALLKLAGLAACAFGQPNAGLPLRCMGLAISGTFWTIAGISAALANSITIGGIPMVLMGLSSWWLLVRFPSIPASGS